MVLCVRVYGWSRTQGRKRRDTRFAVEIPDLNPAGAKSSPRYERLRDHIQKAVDEEMSEDRPVKMRFIDGVRHVDFLGNELPCGGTHVETTKQLGKIVIGKVSAKKNVVKVRYTIM